jgi:hypothetical protein
VVNNTTVTSLYRRGGRGGAGGHAGTPGVAIAGAGGLGGASTGSGNPGLEGNPGAAGVDGLATTGAVGDDGTDSLLVINGGVVVNDLPFEETQIVCVGDSGGSLHNKMFIVYDELGPVGFIMRINGLPVNIPASSIAYRHVLITYTFGVSAAGVANFLQVQMHADASFTAVRNSATVTATDVLGGARVDAFDGDGVGGNLTGFTITTTVQGFET